MSTDYRSFIVPDTFGQKPGRFLGHFHNRPVLEPVADGLARHFFVRRGRILHILAGSGGKPGGKSTGRPPRKGCRTDLLILAAFAPDKSTAYRQSPNRRQKPLKCFYSSIGKALGVAKRVD
jgi:hypothetical protein